MKSGVIAALALALAFFLAPASASHAQEVTTAQGTPIRILDGENGRNARSLNLPLGKAVIVELPVEARDVLVANPEIVDAVVRTPRRTYLLGLKAGSTNAFFFDAAGKQILSMEIVVERELASLDAAFKRYMPKARINIESMNDTIVLAGSVPSAADADKARSIAVRFTGDEKRVFSMLSIEGNEQVMLRVRVAEMQRTLAKQLGVNMDTLFDIGQVALDLNTENPFSVIGRSLTNAVSTATYTRGNDTVKAAFQALERHGLLRTLAEPTLTAISGESAKFLAGGEFPVPKSRDRDGNVTIEFKPFGVGLAFSPVVMNEGRISLRISTEVSELQQDGAFVSPSTFITDPTTNRLVEVKGLTIPALRVRRAETTVELPSGGSLVMAGLLQEATKHNIDAFPGLKDLPVLGALFQSRDFQNSETELVVVVTPYLVGPVNDRDIRLPTDGFANPTDFETIFFTRLNAVYGKKPVDPAAGKRRFEGPVGFILE